jgi:hypothetical protein
LSWLTEAPAIGWIVNFVIAVALLEALAILVWQRANRKALLIGLLPGLALMLAVKAALSGSGMLVVLCLTAALPLHLIDLRMRLMK